MILVEGFPGLAEPLRVAHGEVVLLRGPNGSGKTSLLRSLAGLPAPLAPARVLVDGHDPATLPATRLRDAAALSPQDARDALVGLTLAGEARLRGRALPDALRGLAAREAATLSSGEARRAALALAAGRARVLLLDEPAEGLDAEGRARLHDAVRAAAREGCVVAADHGDALAGLATRVVHLGAAGPGAAERLPPIPRRDGPLLLEADPAEVAREGRVLRLPPVGLGPGHHVVAGPNGAGKSTLLLHLAGLLGRGRVRVEGRPPRPGATVRVAPPHARDALTRDRVRDELSGCDEGLAAALVPPRLLDRHPLGLSGGEAQRVLLAKVLGRPAPVYLLDEPEAHLDADGRRALRDALARRVEEGACVVTATHDAAFLALAHARLEVPA